MIFREISREGWPHFTENFSRLHHGWRVTLGVIDTEVLERSVEPRAHLIQDNVTFESLDYDDEIAGGELAIVVGLPRESGRHAVRRPRHIFVERSDAGADEALRIDTADGTTLLLRFRATALPEELNGIAPGEL